MDSNSAKYQNNNLHTTIITILLFLLFCGTALSQDYNFTLNQRRGYDKIKVEIWVSTNSTTAQRLGNASLVLQYNQAYLQPSVTQELNNTDSILVIDANTTNPVININSQFDNQNGYGALASRFYSDGYYSLEITHNQLGVGGFLPNNTSTGKGSFVGVLTFDIIGNPSETDLTNIQWSNTSPGNVEVFDIDGNDIKSQSAFSNPINTTILGITILSPKQNNQVIDRDAKYILLDGAYLDAGYPIYFERSINPNQFNVINGSTYRTIDTNLAYMLDYSLNYDPLNVSSNTWLEVGRFAETDKQASSAKSSISGDIFEPKGSAFTITTATGGVINATNFRKPVRII